VITVLVTLIVSGAAVATWRVLSGSNKTIADQLDAVRHKAALRDLYAVADRSVELRGDGVKSRLLVFRQQSPNDPVPRRSDEIAIYDEVGNRLNEAFDFTPNQSTDTERGYRFDLQAIGDFTNSDRNEIIGSYVTLFMNAAIPRPVTIVWDEKLNHYRIDALLSRPLELDNKIRPGYYGEATRRLYQPKTLIDPKHRITLVNAFGTESFAVKRGEPPLLLAAFAISADAHAEAPLIQLRGWRLNFEAPIPQVGSCNPIRERPILFRPRSFRDLQPEGLQRHWTAATPGGISCG
jgi:hypothetical protein